MHARMLIGLLMTALALPSQASTVFRWVDENGVVSFSDIPPKHRAQQLEELQISVSGATNDPAVAQRRQAMTDLANRLAEDRRERAIRQAAAESVTAPAPAVVVVESRHYASAFPQRHHRKQQQRPVETKQPEVRFPRNLPSQNWPAPVRKWGFDKN